MDFAAVQAIKPNGEVVHGEDRNLFAEFYKRKVLQSAQTDEKGQVVTKDVVFVRLHTPGDKTKKVDRPAVLDWLGGKAPDSERFPIQWQRFQDGEKQLAVGTPLTELGLGDAEIRNFEFYNIYTIEHLINVPDGLLTDMPPGTRGIREAGIKHLASKEAEKRDNEGLRQENIDLRARMEALEAQIAELAARKPEATSKSTNKKEN